MPSFGFRDLKGKGATDMWRDGVPIEQIQQLCGHEDKATTEIYVKIETTYGTDPAADAVSHDLLSRPVAINLKAGEAIQVGKKITIEASLLCPCCGEHIHIRIHGDLGDL